MMGKKWGGIFCPFLILSNSFSFEVIIKYSTVLYPVLCSTMTILHLWHLILIWFGILSVCNSWLLQLSQYFSLHNKLLLSYLDWVSLLLNRDFSLKPPPQIRMHNCAASPKYLRVGSNFVNFWILSKKIPKHLSFYFLKLVLEQACSIWLRITHLHKLWIVQRCLTDGSLF